MWMKTFGRVMGQRFVAHNQARGLSSFVGGRRFRQCEGDGGDGGDGGSGGGSGGGDGGGDGGGSGGGSGDGGGERTFSQDDVDGIVKRRLAKAEQAHQTKQRETLKQLEDLRAQKNLSEEHASKLDEQIQSIKSDLMTEKERAQAELDRVATEHKAKLDAAMSETEQWKSRHVKSQILSALHAAASKAKAYNNDQVVAILEASATHELVKDDDGNLTGEERVTFTGKVKDGDKFVEKDGLTAEEVVEGLKAQQEFANLFLADRKGGAGFRPGTSGGSGDTSGMTPTQMISEGLKNGQAAQGG